MSARAVTLLAALLAAFALAAPAAAPAQQRPDISAPSAIVIEASTGDVVFERKADEKRLIASTTKLMTALIALEGVALDDTLTVSPYNAAPAESVANLRAGERMRVADLLRALLLASANDAATTLANGISGSVPAFVREMNARAKELGLRNTSYDNPVGLDGPRNRSTARDLVRLALVLRRDDFFRETVNRPRAALQSGARKRTVLNRNRLVRDHAFVDGVKTGRTQQAGYVLVGSATRKGVTVLSAVLGEPGEAARDADTLALLRYGLGRYRRTTLVERNEVLREADLKYRDEQVDLVAAESVQRVLRRGERAQVRVLGAPAEIEGPTAAGARVGTVEVRVRGRTVARTPLITAAAVEEASLSERLSEVLSRPASLLLVALLLACTVSLVLLRRRVVQRAGGVR
ncbi:MAG: D-alanyl-D-alanine carboxypeptidase [uncultured Solirubrobacteraceae bacterium]|uniref:serine-type D-Ala-D-Ala carboxypeptidase n=1 Tax=uncultured Solirubrobacteraceae bacterium TaxID=1162706 RepID=A0A6J4S414_9ACTN|nr:MAG: D-alanyl-D-alanine carboxypeptidase [uncultured Solirubrobacteraceae bacterium]